MKILAFVKGADSSLKDMASKEQNQFVVDGIMQDVKKFAGKGLRTLVFGMKEISLAPDQNIDKIIQEGWDNLKSKDVECDLTLLGVTGVEDLLQEHVKDHIEDFQTAGIKVWMLTGD